VRSLEVAAADPPAAARARTSKPKQPATVAPGRPLSPPAADDAVENAPAGLLTTGEAANLLHVHPRTVQRLVERGQLSAVHLGAAVRFDPADLARLTAQLKHHSHAKGEPYADVIRPSRAVRVSFSDRLRSQHP
jgi:excisionase family DNA binding protein